MSLRKEAKKLADEADRQGFRVARDRPHYVAYSPDGRGIVSIPKTPSSQRTMRNKVSQLRKYGFEWPPAKKKASGRKHR